MSGTDEKNPGEVRKDLATPVAIEIKKSPLVERRKIPGYQFTESEDQINNDVQALARELQRAVSVVCFCCSDVCKESMLRIS
jgi:hypothetical protein